MTFLKSVWRLCVGALMVSCISTSATAMFAFRDTAPLLQRASRAVAVYMHPPLSEKTSPLLRESFVCSIPKISFSSAVYAGPQALKSALLERQIVTMNVDIDESDALRDIRMSPISSCPMLDRLLNPIWKLTARHYSSSALRDMPQGGMLAPREIPEIVNEKSLGSKTLDSMCASPVPVSAANTESQSENTATSQTTMTSPASLWPSGIIPGC